MSSHEEYQAALNEAFERGRKHGIEVFRWELEKSVWGRIKNGIRLGQIRSGDEPRLRILTGLLVDGALECTDRKRMTTFEQHLLDLTSAILTATQNRE